jgi:hypothetical protein
MLRCGGASNARSLAFAVVIATAFLLLALHRNQECEDSVRDKYSVSEVCRSFSKFRKKMGIWIVFQLTAECPPSVKDQPQSLRTIPDQVEQWRTSHNPACRFIEALCTTERNFWVAGGWRLPSMPSTMSSWKRRRSH